MIFLTEGNGAETIEKLAHELHARGGDPQAIESITIDMSPAFIKGVSQNLPNAQITFDKFHVVAHASLALDKTRRIEHKTDPELKGLRWALLKDRDKLADNSRAELDALLAQLTTKRTARAWVYREQLREILQRKQINVVRELLTQLCTNVMRSKVEPMKEVAAHDPNPSGGDRGLGPDPSDQRLPRSPQRAVPGSQTQGAWLPAAVHHSYRGLAGREAGLP